MLCCVNDYAITSLSVCLSCMSVLADCPYVCHVLCCRFRDPSKDVPLSEITRFPHAVLEVKLQLEDENSTPAWVSDLLNSGMLLEVHKFSKFIHGCAVLLPQDVVGVPYWIDDVTLAPSIKQSGASDVIQQSGLGANSTYTHLLPHDNAGQSKGVQRGRGARKTVATGGANGAGAGGDDAGGRKIVASGSNRAINIESYIKTTNDGFSGEDCTCLPTPWCEFAQQWHAERGITGQKVEPKLFFAAERTFIKWMEMGVILSTIAVGILAFTKTESMPLSYIFCISFSFSF